MSWLPIPARNLDEPELEALVNELALQPERWQELVSFSDQERRFVSLYRDDHVDVWLLCWTPRNDTGWHDHDISAGAVRVVDGALMESSPGSAARPCPARCPPESRSRSVPTTSIASPATASGRCRSMPTRRPCGGWARTRSTATG